MNYPLFHLDSVGNPLLIALIAVTHVLINHPLAVGMIPLVALLEWRGWKTGERGYDELARKVLFFIFIITTTLGALTGVGIWFSTSLVNPDAIGSLIRVFFWGWFIEWIVFCLEVMFIMAYYLTWRAWTKRTEPFAIPGVGRIRPKVLHIAFGLFLSVFSWLTMAIIVGILGFMMDSGKWPEAPEFFNGFVNPLYLPQLLFRTPYALMGAGLVVLALIPFFMKRGDAVRPRAVRLVSAWSLYWMAWVAVGGWLYWRAVPDSMVGNLPTALTTQDFVEWHQMVLWTLVAAVGVVAAVSAWGMVMPRRLPAVALVVPILMGVMLLGTFERVREFIRKPYVIKDYMYANGLRLEDYPLYRERGLVASASYAGHVGIDGPPHDLGEKVFMLACTRCHTVNGTLSIRWRLERLYGNDKPWDADTIAAYLAGMHNVRHYMPPMPGTDEERMALARWLTTLQSPPPINGRQSALAKTTEGGAP
jgi:hypothetical protein